MKIVVLSDTHIPKRAKKLPAALKRELYTADKIFHAGDWQSIDVYEELKQFAPVEGVYGNVDGDDIRVIFPEKKLIQIKGYWFGIVHGHGNRNTTVKRVVEAFEEQLDCIVFGHSHIPYVNYHEKTLLFNPGSATDKRKLPFYSFGIISVGEVLRYEHVYYQSKE